MSHRVLSNIRTAATTCQAGVDVGVELRGVRRDLPAAARARDRHSSLLVKLWGSSPGSVQAEWSRVVGGVTSIGLLRPGRDHRDEVPAIRGVIDQVAESGDQPFVRH